MTAIITRLLITVSVIGAIAGAPMFSPATAGAAPVSPK
jgi:hypothetical protein